MLHMRSVPESPALTSITTVAASKLRKRDTTYFYYKMQGLPSIFSLFRTMFNKFNKTGARMLDSFYHMTLKLF